MRGFFIGPTMNRAYSLIQWKSVDEDRRLIEGIATTPSPDRMNDIVETEGIEYKLPLPLLYQHNSRQPIGQVVWAKKSADGIHIKAQVAASGIAEFIDEAWALIKNGLIRGLSIGFRPIEEAFNKETGGFRFIKSEWMELSAVTIPANAEATILTVKSADSALLAASGRKQWRSTSGLDITLTTSPGVPGLTKGKTMTLREQITNAEAKLTANEKRLDDIASKASEDGRTRSAEEIEECDTLEQESSALSNDIAFMKSREKSMVARAAAVTAPAPGQNAQKHGESVRQSQPIQVRSVAPKGIFPARMAIAMYKANNNPHVAADLCRKHWPDMPELDLTLRAIVEAGDTTTSGWASQLVPSAQQLSSEFLDMYRAQTIIGRIPGLRRVPFNVAVPIRTAAGTFQWVGEAAAKPVTSETFTNITLTWAKAAAIIVITQELAKFSSPDAEILIRDSMIATLTRYFDTHFVSTTAAVANVSPAGILNGIGAITPSGTTAAALRADINNMLNNFTANNVPLSNIVLLMSSTTAVALSLMITDLGVQLFPGISREGGNLLGFPVVVSENVGTRLIGLNASDILIAEDPGINVTASDQATIEMETTPALGEQSPPTTQSVLKSMFQNNMIAIRAEQFKTWGRARTSAVEYINAPAYVPGT